jgi:hypothetical protein
MLAKHAFAENTGARGLVSSVEKALLEFEKRLPSTQIKQFPATSKIIEYPENSIKALGATANDSKTQEVFEKLIQEEKAYIKEYIKSNKGNLADKYSLTMTPSRIDIVAAYYVKNTMDIGDVIEKIKSFNDEIKKVELYFFKNYDINIVLEEDAIDFILEQLIVSAVDLKDVYTKIEMDFKHGLKLAREKTGRNRFFITRAALLDPEIYVGEMIKKSTPIADE